MDMDDTVYFGKVVEDLGKEIKEREVELGDRDIYLGTLHYEDDKEKYCRVAMEVETLPEEFDQLKETMEGYLVEHRMNQRNFMMKVCHMPKVIISNVCFCSSFSNSHNNLLIEGELIWLPPYAI